MELAFAILMLLHNPKKTAIFFFNPEAFFSFNFMSQCYFFSLWVDAVTLSFNSVFINGHNKLASNIELKIYNFV